MLQSSDNRTVTDVLSFYLSVGLFDSSPVRLRSPASDPIPTSYSLLRTTTMPPSQVFAFDIYGTLLDTSSISTALSSHLHLNASEAAEISAVWRRYQLE